MFDFIDTDFSHWEVFLLYVWNGLNPQMLTCFLAISLICGETLNISTVNDSTFTAPDGCDYNNPKIG